MKRLEKEKLFGHGLTAVDSPELADRYNRCLEQIGIEATGLAGFSIDGIGWSPEIAEEKGNPFYLSHGGANQFAIILSPAQYQKPVYVPFNSFTKRLMRKVFDANARQIADVTTDTALWLDIEQDLSLYVDPMDLLMVDSLVARVFSLNGIMEEGRKQRRLILQFNRPDQSWFDSDLRRQIIESGKKHGDLRFRSVEIPDVHFNDLRSFYTRDFGGLYLFRDTPGKRGHLMVFEDWEEYARIDGHAKNLWCLECVELVEVLLDEGVLAIDLGHYRQHRDALEIKREAVLVETISRHYPDLDYDALTVAQKKNYVQDLRSDLPPVFFELERFIKQLKGGQSPKVDRMSMELKKQLVHPAQALTAAAQETAWQLVTEINPADVFLLYCHNKRRFFEKYPGWPSCKKGWAVNLIKQRYVPQATV